MAIYNGTAGNDYIVGSAGDDEIYGLAGNNWLEAGDGDDIVVGGDGLNYILGQGGNDTLTGGAGVDIIYGDTGNDIINGGDGNDFLVGGSGDDIINGGDGDDIIYGDGIDSTSAGGRIIGGLGYNTIYARAGINSLYAVRVFYAPEVTGNVIPVIDVQKITTNQENEEFIESFSSVAATTGVGTPGNDIINGGAGNDTIYGGAGDDIINGGAGNDTIYGGAGDDIINGGDGDDWIEGGAGADTLDGGAGVNTLSYAGSPSGVSVNLTTGAVSGGDATGDTISNFVNIIGSDYDDILYGNALDNVLYGGDGNDRFYVYDGDDIAYGGAGNDIFYSSAGADTFHGGDGSDRIDYRSSPSAITISLIDNTASGGWAEGDTFTSIENITGSNYSDTIICSDNGSHIIDYGGNNTIYGGAGNDFIRVLGTGENTIYGGAGNDWIFGNSGADILDGGEGVNILEYRDGSNSAYFVSLMDNTVSGGWAEGDTISNFQHIFTGNGDDILIGDDKDNIILGRGGADTMTGNGGNDVFYYENWGGNSDSTPDAYDTITDFTQGEDILRFNSAPYPNMDWTGFSWDNSSGTETILTHEEIPNFEVHFIGVYEFTEDDFSIGPYI